ncbi:MAG: hypothetical protein HAW60_01435 [Bdellovibrionales bacterium]|nr:hypothetical protein [Bdellovibrionales bacterium]
MNGNTLLAEENTADMSFKSISTLGVKKIFLHVQNSELKLNQNSDEKHKIKIFSNFSSLLNKVTVKQLKQGTSLHIWILKNNFFEKKNNINESKHIGKVLIQMPAIPVVLTQNLGSIFVESWKSSLTINKWSGNINVKNTQSNLNIFSQKGDVNIDNYKGKLKIESYNNKLSVRKSSGVFRFNIFSGGVVFNKLKANIELTTYNASLAASDIEGFLSAKAKNSYIKLKNIKSTTKININKGEVKVNKVGPASLKISSLGRASINVNLDGRSAKVRLLSYRFKTKAPSSLKRKSLGKGEQVTGILSGTSPKAFVVLKSREGRITLNP